MSGIQVGTIVISELDQWDRPDFKATVRAVTENGDVRLLGYTSLAEATQRWWDDLSELPDRAALPVQSALAMVKASVELDACKLALEQIARRMDLPAEGLRKIATDALAVWQRKMVEMRSRLVAEEQEKNG